jgi:hypothetical protein
LIVEGKPKDLPSADYAKKFTMDGTHAEPAVQAPDGLVLAKIEENGGRT